MGSGLTLPLGTVLHRDCYRIDGYLASGGFGNTYVATDLRFGGKVAVKEFFMRGVSARGADGVTVSISVSQNRPLFDEQMQKFRKEAKRLHRLDSKHIVKVSDLFDENGTTYYVMEFIDGGSVADMLKARKAPLDEDTAMGLLQQMLDALGVVHAQDIWHLDIKPQNIMVTKQGVAKLIDFGASKQLRAGGGATTSTGLSFTPGYAPMEQVEQNNRKFGAWTDLYSLGATFYSMVSNRKPPLPSDVAVDGDAAFTFPDTLSDRTRKLIVWMMQPNRTKRPQCVAEVQQWLGKPMPPKYVHKGTEATQVISKPETPGPKPAEPNGKQGQSTDNKTDKPTSGGAGKGEKPERPDHEKEGSIAVIVFVGVVLLLATITTFCQNRGSGYSMANDTMTVDTMVDVDTAIEDTVDSSEAADDSAAAPPDDYAYGEKTSQALKSEARKRHHERADSLDVLLNDFDDIMTPPTVEEP